MNRFTLKRSLLLWLLLLVFIPAGCKKPVALPPPAPAPPPPPPPPPPAPGITLSADRTTITAGQSVTLTWQSTNASGVTIQPGVGAVTASGTRQVSPTATTSYTAEAKGPGGTGRSAAVTITVNPAPPPPAPPTTAKPAPPPPPPPAPPKPTMDQLFSQTMVPILFDFDKSAIRSDQESKLLNIASWLKQNPTERFTIEGHADERGSQEYNIALGDERAASTMKYLSGQGIATTRMTTVSYGEERPECRDMTEDCWQRNRRAAFVRAR